MGKLLDKYTQEFNETIKASIDKTIKETGKRPELMVKPAVWIAMKYLDDNQTTPFSPQIRDFFMDTVLREPEFGEVVASGLLEISKMVDIPLPFDKISF